MTEQSPTTETNAAAESPLSLLYSEPATETPTETGETVEATETEETTEVVESADDNNEPESSAESTSETSEPEGGDDDGVEIASLSELAEHLETEQDYLTGLEVPIKVNGETHQKTIAELVASAQIGMATANELEVGKQKSAQMMDSARQEQERWTGEVAAMDELIKKIEAEMTTDEASIAHLRTRDPAEHTARKLEIKEKRERVEAVKEEAQKRIVEIARQAQQQSEAQRVEVMAEQADKLLGAIPEWKDSELAKTEKGQIGEYLVKLGYSAEDISNTLDHRLFVLARDSMLYNRSKGKVEAAKKKRSFKLRKTLKPGSTAGPSAKPATGTEDPVSILYG